MSFVRHITDDDIPAVADLTARAFGQDEVEQMRQDLLFAYKLCPFIRKDLGWVSEEAGRILAKWQVLDFKVRVAGTELRMGGVQGVVAEPDQRGRGPALQIVPVGLKDCLDDGMEFVLGFAQRAAFYHRIGAVHVMAEPELHVETKRIPRLRDDPFETMDDAGLDLMLDHYHASNVDRSGSMVRVEGQWNWMPRRAPETLICADGYVGYRTSSDAIEIREIGGRTAAFYDAAIRRLGVVAREAGVAEVRGPVPVDHPLTNVCHRYGVETQVRHPRGAGSVGILLNSQSMLTKMKPVLERRLSESSHADCAVDFRVACTKQEFALELNPKGKQRRTVELEISPGGMLQLAFGYKSAITTAHEEQIPLDDPTSLLLDVLFPKGNPFMWEPDRY